MHIGVWDVLQGVVGVGTVAEAELGPILVVGVWRLQKHSTPQMTPISQAGHHDGSVAMLDVQLASAYEYWQRQGHLSSLMWPHLCVHEMSITVSQDQ